MMTRREAFGSVLAVATAAVGPAVALPEKPSEQLDLRPVWKFVPAEGRFVRTRMAHLKAGDVFDIEMKVDETASKRWRCVATQPPDPPRGELRDWGIVATVIGYVDVAAGAE